MLDEFQSNNIEVINLKEITSQTGLSQQIGSCKDRSTINASISTINMKDTLFKQSKKSLPAHDSSKTNLDTRKF